MKELSDLFLLLAWRQAGALGIIFLAMMCALPVVLVFSWFSDPPAPALEVQAAAKESWNGRIAGFRYDPLRGVIAVIESPSGLVDVMFSGIGAPSCDHRTPMEALRWLERKAAKGRAVTVHTLESAGPLFPMRGHIVMGNEWLNGSLVEQGLAQVSKNSPMPEYNAGRDAMRQLQNEAQLRQRGLWRKR